ncbi:MULTISPECIES: alpha/beta hydrolase [unclassified Caulobacter]|uniref:alpha/beta hydrolase n=1 Tax=unclassified Caulobacter TaxID=2648921 RepID=UPI0009E74A5E|nr:MULTISPECIES: alpha/beta hydrolase [unclassified Caulobacter]AZS22856.1 alpha/beta hydrolase [Caulobacter sp. FWC26]
MLKSAALALAVLCASGASAAAAQAVPEGTPIVIGQSLTIESKVLSQTRRINVHLPPEYASSGKTYPVLYLLDGGEKEDFPHIAGLAQLGELSWTYREMIVVGIEGIDRRHDLTHPTTVAEEKADYPTTGGSAAYRRFLAEELKPWVAARYRVSSESAIIGESLAGLFVVETFLKQPTLFDAYIAASPSLWWSDQALARGAAADLAKWPVGGPRKLYLTIGDEGTTMQAGVDKVVVAIGAAKPAGLTFVYDPMHQEHHSTIYHPAALKAFRSVWPGPRPNSN